MISSALDSLLASLSLRLRSSKAANSQFRVIATPAGRIHVLDSGGTKPCVVIVPDGPNVVDHYGELTAMLRKDFRVVCFDMPGFGHSLPSSNYHHSLDQGAQAILAVLDELDIQNAVLAFSCANGFYGLRLAQTAPHRVLHLVLSQTPSLDAMHAWSRRVVPRVLHIPIVGQVVGWLARHKAASAWYRIALPKGKEVTSMRSPAMHALSCGGCFSLAGVVQGLAREDVQSLRGVTTQCTMFWGLLDRSHRLTDPSSLIELVPHAKVILCEVAGHFPDVEEPERLASYLRGLLHEDA
jgi:pimeloyl-ACP methyl ester carboxylesterase